MTLVASSPCIADGSVFSLGHAGSIVDGSVVDGIVVDGSVVDGGVVNGSIVDGSVVDGSLFHNHTVMLNFIGRMR